MRRAKTKLCPFALLLRVLADLLPKGGDQLLDKVSKAIWEVAKQAYLSVGRSSLSLRTQTQPLRLS